MMGHTNQNRARGGAGARRRAAFTLVELLTVVVIIGILAGLVTTAAIRARLSARNRAVAAEIDDLVSALKMYEAEVGELPPSNFANQTAVLAHLRKRFPNYRPANWGQFVADASAVGISVGNLNQASALVFWLGGFPKAAGQTQPAGFSANPSQPFQYSDSRTKVYFPFDPLRLRAMPAGTNVMVYLPDNINAPYVYFRPTVVTDSSRADYLQRTYAGQAFDGSAWSAGIAVPYLDRDGNNWREPRSFQIITAGFDNQFGTGSGPRCSQSGTGCTAGDYDNHTNFSQGTIQDEM